MAPLQSPITHKVLSLALESVAAAASLLQYPEQLFYHSIVLQTMQKT